MGRGAIGTGPEQRNNTVTLKQVSNDSTEDESTKMGHVEQIKGELGVLIGWTIGRELKTCMDVVYHLKSSA